MESKQGTAGGPAPEAVVLAARDGFPLAGTVFPGAGPLAVVIHSATGCPQTYYRAFAEHLAAQGIGVVTYDYRGVGGSKPAGTLRRMGATMRDWALLDAAAAVDWTAARFPGRRLAAVGHSFGGQVLGLLPNAQRIDRALLVASQLGYWGHFARKDQPPAWVAMHVLLPVLSHLLGYFPSSKVGLGEDLPKGVALEWARWCRSPNYLFDHLSAEERRQYDRFAAPMLAYKITDDTFASAGSVDKLLEFYPAARPRLRTVSPQDLGVHGIGHFGPFRRQFQETLWQEMTDWLQAERVPGELAAAG